MKEAPFYLMSFKELLRAAGYACVIVERQGEDEVKIYDGWPHAIPMDLWRRPVLSFRRALSEKTLNILVGKGEER